jgi:hypothetical protein
MQLINLKIMELTIENMGELIDRESPLYDAGFTNMYHAIRRELLNWCRKSQADIDIVTRRIILIVQESVTNE